MLTEYEKDALLFSIDQVVCEKVKLPRPLIKEEDRKLFINKEYKLTMQEKEKISEILGEDVTNVAEYEILRKCAEVWDKLS